MYTTYEHTHTYTHTYVHTTHTHTHTRYLNKVYGDGIAVAVLAVNAHVHAQVFLVGIAVHDPLQRVVHLAVKKIKKEENKNESALQSRVHSREWYNLAVKKKGASIAHGKRLEQQLLCKPKRGKKTKKQTYQRPQDPPR